jgi:hypothetical protein
VGSGGRYRWRVKVRDAMPYWLWNLVGWPGRSRHDCGDHDWFNQGEDRDGCYHCVVGRRQH